MQAWAAGRARGAVKAGAGWAGAGVVQQRVGRDAALADARVRAPGALRDGARVAAYRPTQQRRSTLLNIYGATEH